MYGIMSGMAGLYLSNNVRCIGTYKEACAVLEDEIECFMEAWPEHRVLYKLIDYALLSGEYGPDWTIEVFLVDDENECE